MGIIDNFLSWQMKCALQSWAEGVDDENLMADLQGKQPLHPPSPEMSKHILCLMDAYKINSILMGIISVVLGKSLPKVLYAVQSFLCVQLP